jgi:hypothetical protein
VFEQNRMGRKRALAGRADAIADRHLAVSAARIETLSQATPLALAHHTHCILPSQGRIYHRNFGQADPIQTSRPLSA